MLSDETEQINEIDIVHVYNYIHESIISIEARQSVAELLQEIYSICPDSNDLK